MNQPTLKVRPPAPPDGVDEGPPPARTPRRWVGVVVALLAFALLVLGFTVASSLAARVSSHAAWLASTGVGAALLVPALLGFWLRRVGKRRRRRPRTMTMIAVCNGLLVLVAALAASGVTRAALAEHGSWWVAGIARALGKDSSKSPAVARARSLWRWVASVLPGEEPLPGGTNGGSGALAGSAARGTAGSGSGAGAPAGGGTPGAVAGSGAGAPAGGGSGAAAGGAADGGAGAGVGAGRAAGDGGSASSAGAGHARLRFEKRGSAIIVPVLLRGPTRTLKAKMLFDTGATLTTLTEDALRRLGLVIGTGAPTIVTHTANGRVRRRIGVIDGINVGNARVFGGVTVLVCDPCGKGEVVGLLGLNVSRHFRVTLDHDAGEISLAPKRPDPGHLYDIRPFVRILPSRGLRRGPKMTITGAIENRSPRALSDVRVEAVVSGVNKGAPLWTVVRHVPPRGRVPIRIEGLLPAGAGRSYTLKIGAASW